MSKRLACCRDIRRDGWNAKIRSLQAVVISGVLCTFVIAAPMGVWAQGPDSASKEVPVPLNTRSPLGEMIVPEHLRLGTFAIDLGLPSDGETSFMQANLVMVEVLAASVSSKVYVTSKYTCSVALSSASYPLVRAFVYSSNASSSTDTQRAACIEILRQSFDSIDFDSTLIRAEIETLKRSRRRSASDRRVQAPILDVAEAVRKAVRHIYADHSPLNSLLNVEPLHYGKITPDEFRLWIQKIRNSGHVRFLTNDNQVRPYLGLADQGVVMAPPRMSTAKKMKSLVEVKDFDTPSIRAATLVAVDPPLDGKVRNDAVAKYCREKWNADADTEAQGQRNWRRSGCLFENIFDHETWVAFYFNSDDGPDSSLRHAVESIADDPIVRGLAARRRENGRPGHPYVVLFGSQQH